MFDDIGGKIKGLAKVITIIGIIASCICGLVTLVESENLLVGVLVAGLGSLGSWVGSFLLYGFGELIDQTADNNRLLRQISTSGKNTSKDISDLVHVTAAQSTPSATDVKPAAPASPVSAVVGSCTPVRVDSMRVQCPKCQTVQMGNNSACSHCGIRFV